MYRLTGPAQKTKGILFTERGGRCVCHHRLSSKTSSLNFTPQQVSKQCHNAIQIKHKVHNKCINNKKLIYSRGYSCLYIHICVCNKPWEIDNLWVNKAAKTLQDILHPEPLSFIQSTITHRHIVESTGHISFFLLF